MSDFKWDDLRQNRTGFPEAILCEGKTPTQIHGILQYHQHKQTPVLLTRLLPHIYQNFDEQDKNNLTYFEQGHCAFLHAHNLPKAQTGYDVAIVTAGTSDIKAATEAQKTLQFHGVHAPIIFDVGVAGIERLFNQLDEIQKYKILIAVAGMEGALFSVLAGLVRAPVIAVPSSVGYGASQGGQAALSSALSSCAPGVLTVNIDNGFGAAVSAIKMLQL